MNEIRECRHKSKYYICKRLRLLEHLVNKGFYPELTLPDIENPRFKIWKFVNTPELEDAIDEFFANR